MNSTPNIKNPLEMTEREILLESLGRLLPRKSTASVEGNYAYDQGSVWLFQRGGWYVDDFATRVYNEAH